MLQLLAAHVDKKELDRQMASVAEGKRARLRYEAESKPRIDATRKMARAQGHFGHGFATDGRPKLHSGYAHFDVE